MREKSAAAMPVRAWAARTVGCSRSSDLTISAARMDLNCSASHFCGRGRGRHCRFRGRVRVFQSSWQHHLQSPLRTVRKPESMAGMAERSHVAIRGYYRVVIICFYACLLALLVLSIVGGIVGDERINNFLPFVVRLPIGLLGAFSAIGIISLWLGMIWDCAFTVKLAVWSRVKWLLVLLLINWLGGLIYYYRMFKDRPLPQSVSNTASAPASDS